MTVLREIEVLQLRRLPWLVTGKAAAFALFVIAFFVIAVAWQALRALSLDQVPDLADTFTGLFILSLIALLAWTLWPRPLSVLERFGQRHPAIEKVELAVLVFSACLLMATPFVASEILASRLASLRPIESVLADINKLIRARAGQEDYFDWPTEYWGELREHSFPDGTSPVNRTIPGIARLDHEQQRVREMNEIGDRETAALDRAHGREVVMIYDPTCPSDAVTLQSDDLDCFRHGTAPHATAQLIRSHGLDDITLPFRQRFMIAYVFAIAISSVACVYLLGTRLVEFAKWVFTHGLAILIPIALWSVLALEGAPEQSGTATANASAQAAWAVALIVAIMIGLWYLGWRSDQGTSGEAVPRDCVVLVPPLLLLTVNVYVAVTLFRSEDFEYGYGSGVTVFFPALYHHASLVEGLGLMFVPYTIGLYWLRNYRFAQRSLPGGA